MPVYRLCQFGIVDWHHFLLLELVKEQSKEDASQTQEGGDQHPVKMETVVIQDGHYNPIKLYKV